MPPYFHSLDTQKVGNGTVADIATRAFANLLTAAGKKKNVCVVVSDLAAAYDTGARLINRALEDARAELGHQERNITPVDLAANEIYDILRKRLFVAVAEVLPQSPIAGNGRSLPALVEQLGVMRYGHRPRLADVFCGSGQIRGSTGLRRLRLRSEPRGVHAYLGCSRNRRRLCGESGAVGNRSTGACAAGAG